MDTPALQSVDRDSIFFPFFAEDRAKHPLRSFRAADTSRSFAPSPLPLHRFPGDASYPCFEFPVGRETCKDPSFPTSRGHDIFGFSPALLDLLSFYLLLQVLPRMVFVLTLLLKHVFPSFSQIWFCSFLINFLFRETSTRFVFPSLSSFSFPRFCFFV